MPVFISVIIPTYNRADILESTLNKILNQDLSQIEIIISDNCSTDHTSEVVKSHRSSIIKYYKNDKNQGYTFNYLNCIDLATGKYLLISSDEDIPFVKDILNLLDYYEEYSIKLFCGNSEIQPNKKIIDRNGFVSQIYSPGIKTLKDRGFFNSYIFAGVFESNSIDITNLWEEYSKPGFGYLNVYPQQYIVNQMLLKHNSLFSSNLLYVPGDNRGNDYIESYDNNHFKSPVSRLAQFNSQLDYLNQKTSYKSVEKYLLIKRIFSDLVDRVYYYNNFVKSNDNNKIYKLITYNFSDSVKVVLRAALRIHQNIPIKNLLIKLKYDLMMIWIVLKYYLLSPFKHRVLSIIPRHRNI